MYGEIIFQVVVFDDFVSVRPIPNAEHMLIIGKPDESIEPDKQYTTDVYIADHASILIKGHKKGDLEICVSSDEFETTLTIDETEGKFKRR